MRELAEWRRPSFAFLTYPRAVQVDGHERWRYRKVVHEGVHLEHEPEFITCGYQLRRPRVRQSPICESTCSSSHRPRGRRVEGIKRSIEAV